MDEIISITVRFNDMSRINNAAFVTSYSVYSDLVQKLLQKVLYEELQRQYAEAEEKCVKNQSRLIETFQTLLHKVLHWSFEQKRQFLLRITGKGTNVESQSLKWAKFPSDLVSSISSLVHILMFTNVEISDMIDQGKVHCQGFSIRSETPVGDFIVQCMQESAVVFNKFPFLFLKTVKSNEWSDNQQKILDHLQKIISGVIQHLSTSMVGSVCKRLTENKKFQSETRISTTSQNHVETNEKSPVKIVNDNEFLRTVYSTGPLRDALTPTHFQKKHVLKHSNEMTNSTTDRTHEESQSSLRPMSLMKSPFAEKEPCTLSCSTVMPTTDLPKANLIPSNPLVQSNPLTNFSVRNEFGFIAPKTVSPKMANQIPNTIGSHNLETTSCSLQISQSKSIPQKQDVVPTDTTLQNNVPTTEPVPRVNVNPLNVTSIVLEGNE